MPNTAIVIGATGLVGTHLTEALLQQGRYEKVLAVGRKPLPFQHPRLENLLVDMNDEVQLQRALQGDVLFCCIGTTIKKAGSQAAFRAVDFDIPLRCGRIARANGVTEFQLVSAVGARAASANFYLRTKGETEEALKALQFPSLVILRPSLLLGPRTELRFGEQLASWLAPLMPFFLRGKMAKYRPVTAQKVADTMVAQSFRHNRGVEVIEGFTE